MGLDMYAYSANKANAQTEYWDNSQLVDGEVSSTCTKPKEIMYWRKHPNLHGWMERLWRHKGNEGDFNGDELELTWEDIDHLEEDLKQGQLKNIEATGFFWGDPSDEYYYEDDLKFIKEARSQLFLGLKVFYNSSW